MISAQQQSQNQPSSLIQQQQQKLLQINHSNSNNQSSSLIKLNKVEFDQQLQQDIVQSTTITLEKAQSCTQIINNQSQSSNQNSISVQQDQDQQQQQQQQQQQRKQQRFQQYPESPSQISPDTQEHKALKQLCYLSDNNELLHSQSKISSEDLSAWNFIETEQINIYTNKIKQNDNRMHFIQKCQDNPCNRARGKSAMPCKRRQLISSSNYNQGNSDYHQQDLQQFKTSRQMIDELKKLRDEYYNSPLKVEQKQLSPRKSTDKKLQQKLRSQSVNQKQFQINLRYCDGNDNQKCIDNNNINNANTDNNITTANNIYFNACNNNNNLIDSSSQSLSTTNQSQSMAQSKQKHIRLLLKKGTTVRQILEVQANEEVSEHKTQINLMLPNNDISRTLLSNRAMTSNSNNESPERSLYSQSSYQQQQQQQQQQQILLQKQCSDQLQVYSNRLMNVLNSTTNNNNLISRVTCKQQDQGKSHVKQNACNQNQNQIYDAQLNDWEHKVKEVLQQNNQKSNIIYHNRKNYILPSLEDMKKQNKSNKFSFNSVKCNQAANTSFYNILASKMQQQICQKENIMPNNAELTTYGTKFFKKSQSKNPLMPTNKIIVDEQNTKVKEQIGVQVQVQQKSAMIHNEKQTKKDLPKLYKNQNKTMMMKRHQINEKSEQQN